MIVIALLGKSFSSPCFIVWAQQLVETNKPISLRFSVAPTVKWEQLPPGGFLRFGTWKRQYCRRSDSEKQSSYLGLIFLSFIPATSGTCNCISVHWKHMPEHMLKLEAEKQMVGVFRLTWLTSLSILYIGLMLCRFSSPPRFGFSFG